MNEVGPTSSTPAGIPLRGGRLASVSFANQIAGAVNDLSVGQAGPVGSSGRASLVAMVYLLSEDEALGGGWYRGHAFAPDDRLLDPTGTLQPSEIIGDHIVYRKCFLANWLEAGSDTHDLTDGPLSMYPAIFSGWAKDPDDDTLTLPCYHTFGFWTTSCE